LASLSTDLDHGADLVLGASLIVALDVGAALPIHRSSFFDHGEVAVGQISGPNLDLSVSAFELS
jgi:hypothetical protein